MTPVLEPAAQAFAGAASKPPFVYELGPEPARKRLRELQSAPPADDGWVDADGVRVRIVRPRDGLLPVLLFLHGGGWMLGDAGTHDRLVRELAAGADAAVAFVDYDRTPEARYPVAHSTHVGAKAMAYFWGAYSPRDETTASPLRADLDGLPPALVIVAEVDVLRDEGEAYAARLRAAGVRVTAVRYDGTTHDFMMLRPLARTAAARAAIAQAIAALRDAFYASA